MGSTWSNNVAMLNKQRKSLSETTAAKSTRSSVARLVNAAQASNASLGELFEWVSNIELPKSIQYMGVMLTAGGFFDATAIYRTHNENADAVSTLGSIPASGTPNARLSEVRGTGRATRLSLLAEAGIKSWKASGYFEMDVDGAPPTANETGSSSFQPRSAMGAGRVEPRLFTWSWADSESADDQQKRNCVATAGHCAWIGGSLWHR
jgi:hypothetical protein